MASFDLVLQTTGSLHPDGEPDDFIAEYTGIIRCTCDRDGRVSCVGKVRASRIHCDLAMRAGESVFDVCDAHSREMHELYLACGGSVRCRHTRTPAGRPVEPRVSRCLIGRSAQ